MKSSLILYHDYSEHFELLSDEELGQLLRAIMQYDKEGTVPELSGMVKMAFSFIKKNLDIDRGKYENRCERNRQNGEKGGRGKGKEETKPKKTERKNEKPKKSDGFFEKPKKADTDTETDTETETVNETETDTDITESGSGGDFRELVSVYEQNIGTISPLVAEKIMDWLGCVDESLIRYAVEQAVVHEKRSWAYVESILQSHYASGRKTRLDAEKASNKRKKPPDKQEEKPSRYDFEEIERKAMQAVNGQSGNA